jgi:dynein intermediate chain, cytosolic
VPERITYSKAVQTSEAWTPGRRNSASSVSDLEDDRSPNRNGKRLSRREQDYEEIREKLKREIEEELKATQQLVTDGTVANGQIASQNFPARTLTDEELDAVNASEEFQDFIEKSTKVIERALDEEYDVLADYSLGGFREVEDEDDGPGALGKKARRLREVAQFYDERWSKKRMITDLCFSNPKYPELVLASYTKNPSAPHDPDGLVQVWNLHMHDRPEYIFHAQSDILTAKFSPFHPNLIIGGAYSGQVLLWDTRQKSAPALKTPLTGAGHTHPVYSIDIVGTQNANNIISCSTDGVVCGWSVDMLQKPQESLELTTPSGKTEDMAPLCISFPQSDPTYFLAGTEEGSIYACHRYDRAGAKAGVDTRVSYRGHTAPVMSLDFHTSTGPIDLGDLVLSASTDWSVKLWKARPPAAAASTTGAVGAAQNVSPLLEFVREDLVYDAKWSPVRPGVFGLVDGAGSLEIWRMDVDVEVPLAKATPSDKIGSNFVQRSLNKLAWQQDGGKRVAVGGLDGVVTVFEVGSDLGGLETAKKEEWATVKKLMSRLETAGAINGLSNVKGA